MGSIKVGDAVKIVFNWNEDSGVSYQGTVTGISYLSDTTSDTGAATGSTTSSSTQYTGYIAFQADDSVRLGMTATITTIDE